MPEKVMPGQTLLIRAEVKDNIWIKDVKAKIETDAEPDTIRLILNDGSKRNGVYERGWISHDTSDKQGYEVIVTATNIFGKSISMMIPYEDPTQSHNASEIVGGTFTGNYSFAGGNINIEGNLTVNKALIVNSTILLKPESNPANMTGYARLYYKPNDLDTYSKLLLHMDGSAGSTTFTDSAASKTVTNAESHDSYTKLMLHMEGADTSTTFTDTETTPKTVTANGNAQIDTAQSKFGGASGLFDGTGDYLTLADSADWYFGTGVFTIDFWFRFNVVSESAVYVDRTDNTNYMLLRIAGTWLNTFCNEAGVTMFSATVEGLTFSANTWYHIAVVRYGTGQNNMYIFVDGVSKTITWTNTLPADYSFPDHGEGLYIGNSGTGILEFNGWLDEFRVSKGIARWTANFAPPGSAYGNVSYNTTSYKFGTAAGEFHGSGDYLSLADTTDWNFWNEDFTVDFWIRLSATGTYYELLSQHINDDNRYELYYPGNGQLWISIYEGAVQKALIYTNDAVITASNTWYHIAFVRSGNTAYIFLNGVSQTLSTTTAFSAAIGDLAATLQIGARSGLYNFAGYIDELRISKGTARWTSAFDVPTSAYSIGSAGGLVFTYQNGTTKTLAGE
jgi:hypothetical protein